MGNKQMNYVSQIAAMEWRLEKYKAAGRKPPSKLMGNYMSAMNRVRGMVPEQMATSFRDWVSHYKMQFDKQEQQKGRQKLAADMDYDIKQLTREMSVNEGKGLTMEQFHKVAKGERVPVKGNNFKRASWEEYVRRNTKHLTASGKGMSLKQATDLIDDYRLAGSAEARSKLLSKFGKQAGAVEAFVTNAAGDGLDLRLELLSRMEKSGQLKTDHYQTPSKDDVMRAQVIQAWAKSDDSTAHLLVDDDIDQSTYEHHRSGDIARAWDAVERKDREAEVAGYAPEKYEIEDEKYAT